MKSSIQDKIEGTAKQISGNVKEGVGRAIGNPRLDAAGQAEKAEGQAQKKIGDVKKVFGK